MVVVQKPVVRTSVHVGKEGESSLVELRQAQVETAITIGTGGTVPSGEAKRLRHRVVDKQTEMANKAALDQ